MFERDKDLRQHNQEAAQRGGGVYKTTDDYQNNLRDKRALDVEEFKNEELLQRTQAQRQVRKEAQLAQLQSKMIHLAKDKDTAELMTAGRSLVGLHRDVADVLDQEGAIERRQTIETGYKEQNREMRVTFKGAVITMEIVSVGAAIAASDFAES